ncbi:MAG: methylenetetrahydrofolate reductase [NAD(P)H] [Robiginitomaculum sp.]|nr:methylenetetrahydrofolate reductase [NAD(P)H] [Robiginitomaculum sp.]MDQ7078076.1 methylenetetrahydrofolate reductase [NAD(P)H] [Robiginitomaculum sp.]
MSLAFATPNDAREIEVSFEFFPPKSEQAEANLKKAVQKLAPLAPGFVSVTYGAGGTTRERTHRTVVSMAKTTGLKVAAHLTCVGASKADVDAVARAYHEAGITSIVALRGDPPEGAGAVYAPHPDGYAYASDLIAGLKRIADFDISAAGYPEMHPESPDWAAEIENLKRKVDAGANRIITQFCFNPDTLIAYVERVRAAGINLPIIPGIMLQPNFAGLKRMATLCGTQVPDGMHAMFEGLEDDEPTRRLLAASIAANYCTRLQQEGLHAFHFYTLNRADLAYATCRVLGLRPKTAGEAP